MEVEFVIEAVRRALHMAQPEIFNSDQGSQFTSPQSISVLEQAGVEISMDGKGRALDNIFTERFWRSLKYEEVSLHSYATPREARQGISRYIDFYNDKRLHQSLEYRTPAEVYYETSTKRNKRDGGVMPILQGEETILNMSQFLS